jgi:hypothetical protein
LKFNQSIAPAIEIIEIQSINRACHWNDSNSINQSRLSLKSLIFNQSIAPVIGIIEFQSINQ